MKKLIMVVCVLWLSWFGVVSADEIDLDTTIWQVTHGKLGAGGEKYLVLGGFDHHIFVMNRQGKVLARRDVEGIPIRIVTADIHPHVGEEIVAAVLDRKGSIRALDAGLNPLWQYDDDQTFLSLGVGDINQDGKMEIVAGSLSGMVYALDSRGKLLWKKVLSDGSSIGALAVGDVNQLPGDEIVAGDRDGRISILDGKGSILVTGSPKVPGSGEKRHYKLVWIREIQIDDLDGDGKKEIVVGSRPSGMVTVLDGKGRVIWQREFSDTVNSWSNSQVSIGNVTGDRKKEILCLLYGIVLGGQKNTTPIVVLDHGGNIISKIFPPVSYFEVNAVPSGDGYDSIFIGSSSRSSACQITSFSKLGLVQSSPSLSKTDKVTDMVTEKLRMVSSPQIDQKTKSKAIHILQHVSFSEGIGEIERLYRFLQSRESGRLVFEMMVDGMREKADKKRKEYKVPKRFKKGKAHPGNEILTFVAGMEERNIPFYIRVAKNNSFHLTKETIEEILTTAPNSCKGFIANECSYTRKNFTAFVNSLEQVLDVLRRHGNRKLILDQHFDFWLKIPSDPVVGPKLFKPEFREVLVPMYKTNRPHCPELNVGMIVGMWKSGIVEEWGYCAQDDLWKFESIFINPPSDVLLRMEVMAASLGATYYRIEGNRQFLRREGGNYVLEEPSTRHRDFFHSLVRKGVIVPLNKPVQLETSPVLFLKRFNPQEMPSKNEDHGSYWTKVFQRRDILSYDFALKSVRENYLPRLWTGMQHYCDGVFPKTPYGFVCFAPNWVGSEKRRFASRIFSTEGITVSDEKGTRIPGGQLDTVILDSLKQGSKTLPFLADDLFLAIHKYEDGSYVLYLMDTKQFDTRDINTRLRINVSKTKFKIIDVFDNSVLSVGESDIPVTVPAGLFRILKAIPIG
jgi:hypothetical protein